MLPSLFPSAYIHHDRVNNMYILVSLLELYLTVGLSITSIVVVKVLDGSIGMHCCSSLMVNSLKRSVVVLVLQDSPVFGRTLIKNCSGTLLKGVVDVELTKSSRIKATANQPTVLAV